MKPLTPLERIGAYVALFGGTVVFWAQLVIAVMIVAGWGESVQWLTPALVGLVVIDVAIVVGSIAYAVRHRRK